MRVLSAVDLALWDRLGKSLDTPAYRLIGGRSNPRVPVCNTCFPLRYDSDPDELATALDMLWIHGGAHVEGEMVRVGRADWKAPYLRQREHKRAQLDEMLRFAEGHGCRMLALLRHLGDEDDCSPACGLCRPSRRTAEQFRTSASR